MQLDKRFFSSIKVTPVDFIFSNNKALGKIFSSNNLFTQILLLIQSINSTPSAEAKNIVLKICAQLNNLTNQDYLAIRICQDQKGFFEFIFKINEFDLQADAINFLRYAEKNASDYGVSYMAKFYLKCFESFKISSKFDEIFEELINDVHQFRITNQKFREIIELLPVNIFLLSNLIIREEILELFLSSGVSQSDLIFIKKLFGNFSNGIFQRIKFFLKAKGYHKKAFFITLLPKSLLRIWFIRLNLPYVLAHPYIVKAHATGLKFFLNFLYLIIRQRRSTACTQSRRPVLITRAMGGIGDLVMMRASLRLFLKNHGGPLYLRTPVKFFPLFRDITNLKLLDIESPLDLKEFFNYSFTDCPAGKMESIQYPDIKINRIEAFIYGLDLLPPSNIDLVDLIAFNNSSFNEEVKCINHQGEIFSLRDIKLNSRKPLIFVQLSSAEHYKTIHNPELVDKLSHFFTVIIATANPILNSFKSSKDLFALNTDIAGLISAVKLADICLGVDSSLIHIARAWRKPIIALFGPTDGSLLMGNYLPSAIFDLGKDYYCGPCWRNETTKCSFNDSYNSECISRINEEKVLRSAESLAQILQST